jgi:predicted MPP superfamily phosphohydrolase
VAFSTGVPSNNVNKKRFVCCGVNVIFSIASIFIIYGVWVGPYHLDIHHVWIQDEYLGRVLGKKVVIQLSDLHIGKVGRRERAILKTLSELRPDFIFLTGDYVRWDGDYQGALSFLSQLKATAGIWGVMGDYDYSRSRQSCLFCHEEATGRPSRRHSVKFLRNTIEQVNLPGGFLFIGGADVAGEGLLSSAAGSFLREVKGPAIVLSHNPLLFEYVTDEQNVLLLAGDTHGGQIPLPLWLLGILGWEKNARYSQGLFEQNGKKMFVSRGIGTSHLPVRIFRRPEVAVLHFRQ